MSQTFPPPTLTTQTIPDLNSACYTFIEQYCVPKLNPDYIYKGWQNYFSLPPTTNDFAIFKVGTMHRIGTNLNNFVFDPDTEDPGQLQVSTLWGVELDFWLSGANDITGRSRATCLAALMRDSVGVSHFNKFGASVSYSDDPVAAPFRDESNSWVPSWRVVGHGSFWADMSLTVDYFEDATLHLHTITEGGHIHGN